MSVQSNKKVVNWISREEFEEMVESFIQRKKPKFQAKALITAETVHDALLVLKVYIKRNHFLLAKYHVLIIQDRKKIARCEHLVLDFGQEKDFSFKRNNVVIIGCYVLEKTMILLESQFVQRKNYLMLLRRHM
jgi:hypothetical protein